MLSAIDGDTFGSFEPVFWNRLWFPTQQVQSLGLLCNPQHAALAEFPTDTHSNWQWWDLCNHSKPMILDELPAELSPIVQTIDDWNTCRKLGLVFEAQVEQGKLMVCAIDLVKDLDQRPVARQLRHSLLQYMSGPHFAPTTSVPVASLQRLFRPPTWLQQQEASARASSQQPGYEAANAAGRESRHDLAHGLGRRQSVASRTSSCWISKPATKSADSCSCRVRT